MPTLTPTVWLCKYMHNTTSAEHVLLKVAQVLAPASCKQDHCNVYNRVCSTPACTRCHTAPEPTAYTPAVGTGLWMKRKKPQKRHPPTQALEPTLTNPATNNWRQHTADIAKWQRHCVNSPPCGHDETNMPNWYDSMHPSKLHTPHYTLLPHPCPVHCLLNWPVHGDIMSLKHAAAH